MKTTTLPALGMAVLFALSGTAAAGASEASGASAQQEQCSGLDAQAQLDQTLPRLEKPDVGTADARWFPKPTDTSAYDDCAGLAALPVTVEGATGSSPSHVLLFHHGRYIGTATAQQYPHGHRITRVDDNTLTVEYPYAPKSSGSTVPTESTTATFTFDESTGTVVMTGQLPPADAL